MAQYKVEQHFLNTIFDETALNFQEFESCTFTNCIFSACSFIDVTFIDCTFTNCTFNKAKINHVALRTVTFESCKIVEVNFAMCDRLIFEITFKNCILDFSQFYDLNLKETIFTNCSCVAVDFMKANLSAAVFEKCDLYRAEFAQANLGKANLASSFNFAINPQKTKITKAVFSNSNVKGLLQHHDIVVQ